MRAPMPTIGSSGAFQMLAAVTVSASVIAVGAIPFVGLVIPQLIALLRGDHLGRTLPLVAWVKGSRSIVMAMRSTIT